MSAIILIDAKCREWAKITLNTYIETASKKAKFEDWKKTREY